MASVIALTAGVMVGAGFRYWNALPAAVVPPLEASTVAGVAAIVVGIVMLIQLQRSRGRLEAIEPWAVVSVAAAVGLLAGLLLGPLPNNTRAYRGTVHVELTSPAEGEFEAETAHCETGPGTERIAWLSATLVGTVDTDELTEGLPDELTGELTLYVGITTGGQEEPPGVSVAASPDNDSVMVPGAAVEMFVNSRGGRATFSGLRSEAGWVGELDGADMEGSVRWSCSDARLPDSLDVPGG